MNRIVGFTSAVLVALLPCPSRAQHDLVATTTTYEVEGGFSRVGLDGSYPVTADQYVVHSDAVVRVFGTDVFVINRLFADNVLVLDATNGYGVVSQYSVAGTGLNPRDILVVNANKAYITLFESNLVLVCHPRTGAFLGTIDLSSFAVADGLVEADQMVRVEDRVFVALQNLDRGQSPWTVTGASQLVAIDLDTDTVIDADVTQPGVQGIALQLQNPYWRLAHDERSGEILCNNAGSLQSRDGGVERVDPEALVSLGILMSEVELGGELLDFALVREDLAWALVNDANYNTRVVRVDPSTRTVLSTVITTNGFLLSDLELGRDQRIYLADRTASNPGVRVYDAMTGLALAGPLDLGLPPFDLALVESAPTDAPALRASSGWLRAHPNPFNPRVTLTLENAVVAVNESLLIQDARGRTVCSLVPLDGGVTTTYRWDGTDARGRPVASGIYHARVAGLTTPLTLVR